MVGGSAKVLTEVAVGLGGCRRWPGQGRRRGSTVRPANLVMAGWRTVCGRKSENMGSWVRDGVLERDWRRTQTGGGGAGNRVVVVHAVAQVGGEADALGRREERGEVLGWRPAVLDEVWGSGSEGLRR
ncbi:uncharacterized protein A4U43_C01F15150 [Asparagus officinalis]|uniref:Uncharacterized protein n=1 Tax=Asparagus officinalis TaxID=4686 RepID=A0A5P1FU49_ASPOF|nr:uncharacterized protein A4U43_C01F15150 [Asparagus officinalis]